jgi:ABC-2 type transport system ATP-binding protein
MTSAYAIDVKGLKKSFGLHLVVRDLNIQVQYGEVFGFLGANGSGKTTSIRMLCGLLTPDAGEGNCLGYDVLNQADAIKREVGYMPQKFSLYQELTVLENLEFMAHIYTVPQSKKKINEVMDLLHLGDKAKQLAGELSGGWKQRLAFASALVHSPKLLLLDEPTSGIDPLARRDFWDLVLRLSQEGVTTLMSTHYMDEAERCHRLAYLAEGEIVVTGRVQDVITSTRLLTYLISGDLRASILSELKALPGAIQAAWFGQHFHVSTYDKTLILKGLEALKKSHAIHFEEIPSSLEDAFIALSQGLR